MKTIVCPICPECHSESPFAIPADSFNHCTRCGAAFSDETKRLYSFPKCPEPIEDRHCGECRAVEAKACDSCGGRDDMHYRPQKHKCLCKSCRMYGSR